MKRSTTRRRKYRRSTAVMVCVGCDGSIHLGGEYVQDLTKQPWHPSCRRLGTKVSTVPAPRYLGLSQVECGGCGMTITDDRGPTLSTVPWHGECWARR